MLDGLGESVQHEAAKPDLEAAMSDSARSASAYAAGLHGAL
jgi:hypothetical protein